MPQRLEPLLADGVIDEVVARLNGGKEADVWLVRHAGEVVAAKVYKDRHPELQERRRLQGRSPGPEHADAARHGPGQPVRPGRRRGRLEDARRPTRCTGCTPPGVRVPRPVMFYEGVLLMELVVDAHGRPAPRLVDAPLGPGQAAQLYAELRKQVVGMLACDLIHGDLSPYNVLASWNGPVVIDFPQVDRGCPQQPGREVPAARRPERAAVLRGARSRAPRRRAATDARSGGPTSGAS